MRLRLRLALGTRHVLTVRAVLPLGGVTVGRTARGGGGGGGCLSGVAIALGQRFIPYAPTMFARCLKIIQDTLVEIAIYDEESKVRSGLAAPMDSLARRVHAHTNARHGPGARQTFLDRDAPARPGRRGPA